LLPSLNLRPILDAYPEDRGQPPYDPRMMTVLPLFYYPHEDGFSVSDRLFEEGVCLPSGSNLTVAQQERIIAELSRLLASGRAR
jgi:pyridoxal phosphate-dependent aminotransferase EpsN